MGNYRLQRAADADMLTIALYGLENFGLQQAEIYQEKLKSRFQEIANNPLLYQAVDHIREGYRRSVCGSHSIYYRIEEGGIVVVRVLGQQDTDAL